MKNLLRMSLFIVARAGLFLAIVAWIVGQWCGILASGSLMTASAVCFTGEPGIIVGLTNFKVSWRFDVSEEQSRPMWAFDYSEPEFSGLRRQVSLVEPVSGLVLFYDHNGGVNIAVRHWLIITLFTAFNIVLHFIYHKRPEGQPCEV